MAQVPPESGDGALNNGDSRSGLARLSRRTRLALVVALSAVVLAVIGVVAFTGHGSNADYDTSESAFVLPKLDGPGTVSLASLSGRPVVVNFFASWCTACAGELPLLAREGRALKGKLDIVEVNALETGNGKSFAQKYGLAAAVTAVARDVGGGNGAGLYRALGGTNSMPLTAFYNAHGKVLGTHPGAFTSRSDFDNYLRLFYGPHTSLLRS